MNYKIFLILLLPIHYSLSMHQEERISFAALPAELKVLILSYATQPNIEDAAANIRSLTQVNKNYNALINDEEITNDILQLLAKYTNGNLAIAATKLKTKGALDWLTEHTLNTQNPATLFSNTSLAQDILLAKELVRIGLKKKVEEFLFKASEKGLNGIVRALIQAGISPNIKNSEEATPLMIAVKNDKAKIVEFLIKSRADINARNGYGTTPLMHAAEKGSQTMVDLLLKYHADPSLKDDFDNTASDAAKSYGHDSIAETLKKALEKGNQ